MQVAVTQALREWFEAARNGMEGVSGAEVAEAVITLGLHHDYKHVRQNRCFHVGRAKLIVYQSRIMPFAKM